MNEVSVLVTSGRIKKRKRLQYSMCTNAVRHHTATKATKQNLRRILDIKIQEGIQVNPIIQIVVL